MAALQGETLLNKKLLVKLADGRTMSGFLACLDQQENMILTSATEGEPARQIGATPVVAKPRTRLVGTVLIPKKLRQACWAEVPIEDMVEGVELKDKEGTTTTTRLASPAFAPSQLHRPELESYLSTTVAIGSPPRLFEVIVDTGSSLAYVPCSSCKTCGSHMGGSKFAPRKSKTAKSLKCKRHKDCGCDSIDCQCIHNQCYYEIRYAEGSSSRGKLMSDHVRLGSVESRNASVLTGRASFGCATFESGLIRTQKADGILGLSRSKLALLNQMKRGGREASSFGICAAQKTGIFALGRVDPALLVKKCKGPEARMRLIHNRRTRRKHLFAVGLRGAHLGGQGETRGAERRAMVIDTGSTLSYFPKRLFEDLTRQLERVPGTRRVPVRGVQGGHCFSGAEEGGWARWPDLRLVLGNATLAIPPRNYLSRAKQGSEVYCPLFAQSKGHEIHLGSVMLEGFMVEFSARELTIWSKCNCSL